MLFSRISGIDNRGEAYIIVFRIVKNIYKLTFVYMALKGVYGDDTVEAGDDPVEEGTEVVIQIFEDESIQDSLRFIEERALRSQPLFSGGDIARYARVLGQRGMSPDQITAFTSRLCSSVRPPEDSDK